MRQYAIQFVAIKFVDIENELRPPGRSHEAFHLGCEPVVLRQLEIVILDAKKLRARLSERNEKRNRIPGSNQYNAMGRQRRHPHVDVALSVPAATPVKITRADGGDGQRRDCGDDPVTAIFEEPDQYPDGDDAGQHFEGYGIPVIAEAKRPAEVRQDNEYENEIEARCLRWHLTPTIAAAHIAHRKRHESRRSRNIRNSGPPVAERRLSYNVSVHPCPIKWVGNELPEVLRQESRVPNRFRFPVRGLKDLVQVGKCRITKVAPKVDYVKAGAHEKPEQGSYAKHDQSAKGSPPHRYNKSDCAQPGRINRRCVFQGDSKAGR